MRWWFVCLIVILAVLGLVDTYLALIWSPPEMTMGNLVRPMYFHVSCAWIALTAFCVTALFGVLYLIRRKLFFDHVAVASAEIGAVFTTITLVSGSLWARPIWNTWWTWDPRLTTTLILWFLYVGYLLLRKTMDGIERRARVSSVFAIIAFIDVPIIHMSVTWWRSIHPNVITDTGFHMAPQMVTTLMFGFVVFFIIYLVLLSLRTRQEMQAMQVYHLRNLLLKARAHAKEES